MMFKFSSRFYLCRLNNRIQSNDHVALIRFHHHSSKLGFVSSDSSSFPKPSQNRVAIFWDLDNKHPKSVSPYAAAVKLKAAMSSFGLVSYMVAYANRHAFIYVPPDIRDQREVRKVLNQLENRGIRRPDQPYLCRVCGRKFATNEKLVNHFQQLHEREQMKRLNRIESARGSDRVKLVAKYAVKMDKYKSSVGDVLVPKVGIGLEDELKRAGFCVRKVSDKPQAADDALRSNIVDMMDKRRMDCLVLVSDDSDFLEVLNEAKLRCLKTVVVGDIGNGALKRASDASFSWSEILMGQVKKVAGKWKDIDHVSNRLECRYDPDNDKAKKHETVGDIQQTNDGDLEVEDDDNNGSTQATVYQETPRVSCLFTSIPSNENELQMNR